MSKKLVIVRTVTSVSLVPLLGNFYEDMTEQEAIAYEKDLPLEEWAESFFEDKVSWNTTVVVIDVAETDG